jgi:di/tricarboxylate transporter
MSVGSNTFSLSGKRPAHLPHPRRLPPFSGFLHKDDFNALPWHLLALIAGGNALGLAVHESGLLEDLVGLAFSMLHDETPWLLTVQLVSYI